jgi:hypothetical protein
MQNFTSSIIQAFQQRFASPIIGSFVISWCIFNIKTLITLVSLNGYDRVNYINKIHFNYCNDLFYPIILSVFYLIAIPFIQRWFEIVKYHLIESKRKKDIHNRINLEINDDSQLNEKIASSRVEYHTLKLERNLELELEKSRQNLTNWKNDKDELESKIDKFNSEINSLQNMHDHKEKTLTLFTDKANQIKNIILNPSFNDLTKRLNDFKLRLKNQKNMIIGTLQQNTENKNEIIQIDELIIKIISDLSLNISTNDSELLRVEIYKLIFKFHTNDISIIHHDIETLNYLDEKIEEIIIICNKLNEL